MEFAAETAAWHLDWCSLRKNDVPNEGRKIGKWVYGCLSIAHERKASCVTCALSVIMPLLDLGAGEFFFSFLQRGERDRYPRLYYKYTCNSVSSPTMFSVNLCNRPHIHVSVSAGTRMCIFVLGRSRYHIYLYIHRYILGGSRLREASEAQPFSYRSLSPSVLSLFLARALLARGPAARMGH